MLAIQGIELLPISALQILLKEFLSLLSLGCFAQSPLFTVQDREKGEGEEGGDICQQIKDCVFKHSSTAYPHPAVFAQQTALIHQLFLVWFSLQKQTLYSTSPMNIPPPCPLPSLSLIPKPLLSLLFFVIPSRHYLTSPKQWCCKEMMLCGTELWQGHGG